MRNSFIIFFVLCILGFVISCATNTGPVEQVETLIPGEAIAAIHIQNADMLMDNLDGFFQELGGLPVFGNLPVRTILDLFMNGKTTGEMSWFNFSKSWACALLPGGDEGEFDFILQVYIPLIDPVRDFPNVKDFLKSFTDRPVELYGDYVIVSSKDNGGSYKRPKKEINISKFETFSEGTLTFYINPPNAFAYFGLDTSKIKALFSSFMDMVNDDTNTPEMDQAMDNAIQLVDILLQVEEFFMNAEIGSRGINGKSLASFDKEGTIGSMLGDLPRKKGAKEYLKYVSASSLFSYVETHDKARYIKNLQDAMKLYSEKLTIGREKLDEWLLMQERMFDAQGLFSVYSFDLEVDLSMLQDIILKPEEKNISQDNYDVPGMVASIMESLYFYAESIVELKDKEGYRKEIDGIMNSGVMKELIGAIWSEFGITLTIQYDKDREDEDFVYDEITLVTEVDVSKADLGKYDDPKLGKEVYKIMAEFIETLVIQFHYTEDRLYMLAGRNTLPLLKKLVKEDAFPGPTLYDSPFFTACKSGIPDTSFSIGHFSLTNLLSYVRNVPELSQVLSSIEQKPGIIFYTQNIKNNSEFAFFWDIEEIALFVHIAGKLLPLFQNKMDSEIAME
jgi:hypothetical protein